MDNQKIMHVRFERIRKWIEIPLDISDECILTAHMVSDVASKYPEFYEKVVSIEIPEGIEEIGCYAFSRCNKLKSVKLPSTIVQIGARAFSGCVSLKNIELPESLVYIGEGAFYQCGITSITITKNVDSVMCSAFANCFDLRRVVFDNPDTNLVESSDNDVGQFYSCHSLISVRLPANMKRIPRGLFKRCDSLSSISLPPLVTSIGEDAFAFCIKLVSINLDNVTYIGDYAFTKCGFHTIVIHKNMETIRCGAFHESRLEKFTVKSNDTELGYAMLRGCNYLTTVSVPNLMLKTKIF